MNKKLKLIGKIQKVGDLKDQYNLEVQANPESERAADLAGRIRQVEQDIQKLQFEIQSEHDRSRIILNHDFETLRRMGFVQ